MLNRSKPYLLDIVPMQTWLFGSINLHTSQPYGIVLCRDTKNVMRSIVHQMHLWSCFLCGISRIKSAKRHAFDWLNVVRDVWSRLGSGAGVSISQYSGMEKYSMVIDRISPPRVRDSATISPLAHHEWVLDTYEQNCACNHNRVFHNIAQSMLWYYNILWYYGSGIDCILCIILPFMFCNKESR